APPRAAAPTVRMPCQECISAYLALGATWAYSAHIIIDYTTHTVLITGASSGIGSEVARALAQRGAALVLVARRLDRLDALADDLRREYDVAVETVRLDLTSPQAATDLHRITRERGIRVTGLINNAGFGTFGPFSAEDLDRLHQEIAVDVVAPMSLSSVFLAELTAARGFLINVASMAAYVPTPRMAVYGATKAFVL